MGERVGVAVAAPESSGARGRGPLWRPRPGRAEASRVVWDWRGERTPKVAALGPGRARLRGTLQALAGATVGALIFTFLSRTVGTLVLSIAGLILLSALASPTGLYAAIERLFAALGQRLGSLVSWVVLPLLFYAIFLPFGWLFRRGRRDPMKRFYEADADTYWSPHAGGRTASASRSRQY
ncbi:MAG: hypothetical protein V3U03_14355 [Myxococcota bacterium]